ncbi:zinc finger protein 714 isoform X6 [Amyelois transitella]|uniref:zinc finger protein 714 isoform X6 n=1 Tax=Amyelois transitella TaxID=680683 RepID=UPI00298FC1A6|nr:zinc finger protein 714 isoform X6 [Amyelois transitella]
MAAKSEWRPGPTVCRCCLTEGCYKDISTEYFWMGKREVYAEMLKDTLEVTIAYSKAGGPNSNSRLICESCISRLRDATEFKRQVVECERMFMQHLDPGSSSAAIEAETEPVGKIKVEGVKLEKSNSDDDFDNRHAFGDDDDDDDDDLDNQPLTKLASKMPTKESVDLLDLLDNSKTAEKRKSSTKVKPPPPKKAKSKVEQVKVKPSGSKLTPKPEKKKKGDDASFEDDTLINEDLQANESKIESLEDRKRMNDEIKSRKLCAVALIEYSRICPFRWMKNLYLCMYCEQNYSDPADLREHHAIEHSNLSFSQIKYSISKLKPNELIKIDITNVGCKLCNKIIKDFEELKAHLSDNHNVVDLKYSDGVLPFKVTKNDFKCAICDEKYDEFKTLNQHMNIHFQNFICEQCGNGFMTPERLRTHSYSHETGSFQCERCDKVFKSMNAKNEHFAVVHMRAKRHRCPHCPEAFKNYFQRNKHISNIHGMKLKEFKCSMCPKIFFLSGKLGVHIRTVHLKEKRHACDSCEWKFYSKSELKEHMVKHGGERKYKCDVCKKAYARKYTLTLHTRIHDHDKRFICAACGMSFVQNCSLKKHIKIHHPDLDMQKIS